MRILSKSLKFFKIFQNSFKLFKIDYNFKKIFKMGRAAEPPPPSQVEGRAAEPFRAPTMWVTCRAAEPAAEPGLGPSRRAV